jgi:predicted MFS family arabinose efflux permease
LQLGMLAGPVIGGVLVAVTGPSVAFGVDAATFAVSAATLALMRTTGPRRDASAGVAGACATASGPAPASIWALLRRARILQIILVVSVTANFALIGTTDVALPALAHARFGADGYGVVLTCVAMGSLAGTLIVARLGRTTRPAALIGAAFLVAAVAIGLAPFLGGLPGVAGAMLVFGVAVGFDNVLAITMLQQWAPPDMLGRVMGLVMMASVIAFPVSTAVAGLLTRHLGPSAVFPIAGVLLAVAMLGGLSQREFREFDPAVQPDTPEALATDVTAS